jgi:hypothetical protein
MEKIKHFCRALLLPLKQVCLFPWAVAEAFKKRGQQTIRNELEAERLDRIRNPSKYLGK